MTCLRFSVTAWAAWSVDRPTQRDWLDWAGDAESAAKPDGRAPVPVPTILRRRVSPVGQNALRAAFELPEIGAARFVLSSRHGEFARTLALLKTLADREPLSPADFSLSVHHALIGLLSIATRNRLGHTAVAAGRESFGFGLLEAAATAAERPGNPVVLMHFDEPLPPDYQRIDGHQEPSLALALSLECPPESSGSLSLAMNPVSGDEPPSGSLALEFLSFLLGGTEHRQAIGERMIWQWNRCHALA